jgi:hypothetical protein
MSELESQLKALQTASTVNTVMSGLIICLSIIKPVLMEFIRRKWQRRENERMSRGTSVEEIE